MHLNTANICLTSLFILFPFYAAIRNPIWIILIAHMCDFIGIVIYNHMPTILGTKNTINAWWSKIKRTIKHASNEQRLATRQAQSVPILNKLHDWLVKNKPRVATDSLTGKAMTYLHNQCDKLNVYFTDGQLRISNIMAENAIRQFAVGRRSWLFADTPAGADASAALYSLIEPAKLQGIEQYAYLNAIFKAMPNAETIEDVEVLLPWQL